MLQYSRSLELVLYPYQKHHPRMHHLCLKTPLHLLFHSRLQWYVQGRWNSSVKRRLSFEMVTSPQNRLLLVPRMTVREQSRYLKLDLLLRLRLRHFLIKVSIEQDVLFYQFDPDRTMCYPNLTHGTHQMKYIYSYAMTLYADRNVNVDTMT